MNDNRERFLANRILEIASKKIRNCRIRFGRTHKVSKRFNGIARFITWKGPCKRRGGAFVLICDYSNLRQEEHKMVLLQMMQDYSSHLLQLKLSGAIPDKKRRKGFEVCRNTTINASNDLELFINDGWISFGAYIPSNVRELQVDAVNVWLGHNQVPEEFCFTPSINKGSPDNMYFFESEVQRAIDNYKVRIYVDVYLIHLFNRVISYFKPVYTLLPVM